MLGEELEGKCFAQDHGVGEQPVWDFQQDLILIIPGSLTYSVVPFINTEGWNHLGHLDPFKYPAIDIDFLVCGSVLESHSYFPVKQVPN